MKAEVSDYTPRTTAQYKKDFSSEAQTGSEQDIDIYHWVAQVTQLL